MPEAPISNALVGRLAWSSIALQNQRTLLLDHRRHSEALEVIDAPRKDASAKVAEVSEHQALLAFSYQPYSLQRVDDPSKICRTIRHSGKGNTENSPNASMETWAENIAKQCYTSLPPLLSPNHSIIQILRFHNEFFITGATGGMISRS
jgi:hypothetical protein